MGLAESSESTFYLGLSTTEGTEPTTYNTMSVASHAGEPSAQTFQDETIDPSGKALDQFRHSVGGQLEFSGHWRPSIFDGAVQAANRGLFSSALNLTLTATFGTPSSGMQTISDDGAGGVLGAGLNVGDLVLIAGAVASAANAGLRMVTAINSTNSIDVYNPTGVWSAADAGVDFDHNGVVTLGTTGLWLYGERIFSDGTNIIRSGFFGDQLVERYSLEFPAAGPTRVNFRCQGDVPTFVNADGSPPITKQRGGSDNAASTARLVHGMDDVSEVILYSATTGIIVLTNLHNLANFEIARPIRRDTAVGTPNVINTAAGRPTVSGALNAYLTEALAAPNDIADLFSSYPDDLMLWIIAGASNATAYAHFFNTVRFQRVPDPVGGNNQALLLNSNWSAVDYRCTRIG